jgi:hypothetical protein
MDPLPPAPDSGPPPAEPTITFTCWCCRTVLDVPANLAGQDLTCPQCKQTSPVPGGRAKMPPAPRRWPAPQGSRYDGGPASREVPSYLAPAILVTLFCCTLFGIVAIVYAAQVGSHVARGDYAGAQASSNHARMWCWMSFGLGLVAVPLVIYLRFVVLQPPRPP